jgi:membrane-associated protease RseP (regulator of RpoE activity)
MTGPKHLWSGDWEDESTPQAPPADARPVRDEAPSAGDTSGRPRSRGRRRAWFAVVAVAAVAVAAIVLSDLGGAPKRPGTSSTFPNVPTATTPTPATPTPTIPTPTPTIPTTPTTTTPTPPTQTAPTPTTPTTPTQTTTGPTPSSAVPTPPVSTETVDWLGMEIVTLPPDAPVVETVSLNSEADRAGLEPGDVIQQINGHVLQGAAAIPKAIDGLHPGDTVSLDIVRRSSLFQTRAKLGAPPSTHP